MKLTGEALAYFSDPLTGALFDRTEQQRRRHTEIATSLRGPSETPSDLSAAANAVMFADLLEAIEADVLARVNTLTDEAVRRTPSIDLGAVALAARQDVLAEYQALHDALPVPAFDHASHGESYA